MHSKKDLLANSSRYTYVATSCSRLSAVIGTNNTDTVMNIPEVRPGRARAAPRLPEGVLREEIYGTDSGLVDSSSPRRDWPQT